MSKKVYKNVRVQIDENSLVKAFAMFFFLSFFSLLISQVNAPLRCFSAVFYERKHLFTLFVELWKGQ